MATKKKMLQAAAGQAGGAGLDIDELFSTYLYTGNGSARSINNGIDLSNEGGIILTKSRGGSQNFALADTEQGVGKYLQTNSTLPTRTDSYAQETYIAFNNNGYNLGIDSGADTVNRNGYQYVSWTCRKAPKFFDVVTYNGTGSAQNINHDLGAEPGMIIVKSTSGSDSFRVYHRGAHASSPQNYYLNFNEASAPAAATTIWNDTAPTSTQFTVGTSASVNGSSDSYIAYLFAHNNNNGGFGPDGDADVIKCDTYTGNGSTNGPEIDLGFEPQLVMIKSVDDSGHWLLIDVMRGAPQGTYSTVLRPNTSDPEANSSGIWGIDILPNGFKPNQTQSQYNANGSKYIYMAIRRGPLAPPESATEVFDVSSYSSNGNSNIYNTGFNADLNINTDVTASENNYIIDRLRGSPYLKTNDAGPDATGASTFWNTGNNLLDIHTAWWGNTTGVTSWSWKRAPGYFDVVAFTSQASGSTKSFSHNLTVAPEMVWFKNRPNSDPWLIYHSALGLNKYLVLNTGAAEATEASWISTPSATEVTGIKDNMTYNNSTYIAYLFASLPGISKVGSYTGTGATLNIDCGFTSGARFVLLKRTDSTGEWRVFDTARGIVAGNDPLLNLNSTNPQEAFDDLIDPYSAGFTLTSSGMVNVSGGSYIFYAIA